MLVHGGALVVVVVVMVRGGGGQMVKPLKNVDLFTFGGQMDSLKKKPSKLIYFECRFDVNLFL